MLPSVPKVFLAYAPRGAGLRCALAYLADERDVYGWFTGPDGGGDVAALYFVLEGFYTAHEPRYATARTQDLHSQWLLDERRRHELAELQEMFAAEWLFERSDPGAMKQLEKYARAELATGAVNVRYERIARFSKLHAHWTFYSPGFEHGVLRRLARRWPLEYRAEDA